MRTAALLLAPLALAALLSTGPAHADAPGSSAFCLFALPADNGTQRFINLGIVQYVDVRADEVRLAFGGGNLGSGHEARIPIANRDEAAAVLARLRDAAARCVQPPSGAKP